MLNDKEKKELKQSLKRLSKWLKIEFTLSIFGEPIIHWVYPPREEE